MCSQDISKDNQEVKKPDKLIEFSGFVYGEIVTASLEAEKLLFEPEHLQTPVELKEDHS